MLIFTVVFDWLVRMDYYTYVCDDYRLLMKLMELLYRDMLESLVFDEPGLDLFYRT